jgi:hypothetical protein
MTGLSTNSDTAHMTQDEMEESLARWATKVQQLEWQIHIDKEEVKFHRNFAENSAKILIVYSC